MTKLFGSKKQVHLKHWTKTQREITELKKRVKVVRMGIISLMFLGLHPREWKKTRQILQEMKYDSQVHY